MKSVLPVFAAFVSLALSGAALAEQAGGETGLPAYLQPGQGHLCLNEFSMPSRETCDQFLEAVLKARDQGDCTMDRLTCLGMAFGYFRTSGQARDELIDLIVAYRQTLAEQYIFDQQAATAQIGAAVPSTTFMIDGEPFTIPDVFRRDDERTRLSGRIFVDVWSNLDTERSCPETAFVLLNYRAVSGPVTFERWFHQDDWNSNYRIVRRVLGTGGEGASPRACRGLNDYDIVYHFFDDEAYFGSLTVPAADLVEEGDGMEFVYENFERQMLEHTNQFSSFAQ